MKPILTLLIMAGVASGCSQRDACTYQVNKEIRTMEALAAETRANIARGYAISTTEVPYVVEKDCSTTLSDAPQGRRPCPEIEYLTESKPVAIDLNAERAKLRSLEERLAQMHKRRASALADCEARYPE